MIGETLVDRFKLEKRLGSGAQGEVYLARDLHLSRSVAIKIPPKTVDEDYLVSFKREAKLLVKFEHANVVTLYDFYETDEGLPFLVMEYLSGQPLDERMRDTKNPLSRKQLRAFTKQICGALHKAHEAGLIHRDIKPSNVMLVDEGKRGERFVILDLGVAKLADFVTITNPTVMSPGGDFSGTIAYMSPEQLEGSGVDHSSDIYSFGTTLYQVLTGKLPFEPPDTYSGLFGFMQKVVNESPPPLSDAKPLFEVSRPLERLVEQCMEKDKANRPESMHVVAEQFLNVFPRDLKEVLTDTQVIVEGQTTEPSTAGVRKLWFAAGGGMVLSLALFLLLWPSSTKEVRLVPQPPKIELALADFVKVEAGQTSPLHFGFTSIEAEDEIEIQLPKVTGIKWSYGTEHVGEFGGPLNFKPAQSPFYVTIHAQETQSPPDVQEATVLVRVNAKPLPEKKLSVTISPSPKPVYGLTVSHRLDLQSGETQPFTINITNTKAKVFSLVELPATPGIKWFCEGQESQDFGKSLEIKGDKSEYLASAKAMRMSSPPEPRTIEVVATVDGQRLTDITKVTIRPAPAPKLPAITFGVPQPIRSGDQISVPVSFDRPIEGKKVEVHLPPTRGIRWQYDGQQARTGFNEGTQISVDKQFFNLVVIAELSRNPPSPSTASIAVTIDGKKLKATKLPIEIQPPNIWPQNGSEFEIAPDAELYQDPATTQPGQKRYFPDKIFALLPAGASKKGPLRVPFRLIHRGRLLGKQQLDNDDRRAEEFQWEVGRQPPFYLMENKVSNELVLAFLEAAEEKSKFDAEAWTGRSPLFPNAPPPITTWEPDGFYEWLMHPEKNPHRPAMFVTADEAHAVAQWLTHQRGKLPRTRQWDIAAGTFDRGLEAVKSRFPNGPYQFDGETDQELDIAIGYREGIQPPAEVGTSKDDVSAYSCRDMAGNGSEYVDDGFFEYGLGPDNPSFYISNAEERIAEERKANPKELPDVTLYTRGLSYESGPGHPLSYDVIIRKRDKYIELVDVEYLEQGRVLNSRLKTIGFRAVLEIPPQ